jgi:preprotein translocase subunit SecE
MARIKEYLKESYNELKKVNWPTKSETLNLTLIVIGFSLVISFFLGVLDILFSYVLKQLVL